MDVTSDAAGFGRQEVQAGDLVIVNYTGYLAPGEVFDSTIGEGKVYRDGGLGVSRPLQVRVGGDPVPGIVPGFSQGILGMRIGGRRTFVVPPELGFGGQAVLGPYAVIPANSTLRYEVELVRLSRSGPDNLTSGISRCGAGGAGQQSEGCGRITYAEF